MYYARLRLLFLGTDGAHQLAPLTIVKENGRDGEEDKIRRSQIHGADRVGEIRRRQQK